MAKKPQKGKDEGAENLDAKIQMYEYEVKKYQMRIVEEQQRADRAKTTEIQLRNRQFELDKDFKTEKDKLFNISNDMNRQYKQMQDELLKDINELKKSVVEKDTKICIKLFVDQYFRKESQEENITDLVKDYEQKLKKKEMDISDYKRKIEDMSNEFASMLRETLDKMQERIELAQWDNDSDPQIMKRFKDIAGMQNQ